MITQCSVGSNRFSRARYIFVSVVDVTRFLRTSSPSSRTVKNASSSAFASALPLAVNSTFGAAPSFIGFLTVSSTIEPGTGSNTSDGATLFGRFSLRISTTSSRCEFSPSSIIAFCTSSIAIPAIAAASSIIAAVIFGMPASGESACAPGRCSGAVIASNAPGNKVWPRPAAEQTASRRRRDIANVEEVFSCSLMSALLHYQIRCPIHRGITAMTRNSTTAILPRRAAHHSPQRLAKRTL